jgi:hypothetical protein
VSDGITVVEAAGEIDLATAGFLVEHLEAATASGRPDVLVDLRRVEFFDCSGLRVLCRASVVPLPPASRVPGVPGQAVTRGSGGRPPSVRRTSVRDHGVP